MNVGDAITFIGHASDPRGMGVNWEVQEPKGKNTLLGPGLDMTYEWKVSAKDVGETITICFVLYSEGEHHRNGYSDDSAVFLFEVLPPGV